MAIETAPLHAEFSHDVIFQAIKEHRILEFHYGDGWRLVEPYCLGKGKTEKYLLRGYQIEGYSKSTNTQGWRLFDLAKVAAPRVLQVTFQLRRTEYDPHDEAMQEIFCRI